MRRPRLPGAQVNEQPAEQAEPATEQDDRRRDQTPDQSGEPTPRDAAAVRADLASTYGTARNTAREAVRLLAEAGLVITDQGKGSFVRPSAPLIRLGNDRYSPTAPGDRAIALPAGMRQAGQDRAVRGPEHRPRAAPGRCCRTARRIRQDQVGAAAGERLLGRRRPGAAGDHLHPVVHRQGNRAAARGSAAPVRHPRRPRRTAPQDDPHSRGNQRPDAAPRGKPPAAAAARECPSSTSGTPASTRTARPTN